MTTLSHYFFQDSFNIFLQLTTLAKEIDCCYDYFLLDENHLTGKTPLDDPGFISKLLA